MPFIPHTQADIDAMLAAIGARSIEDLFDEIPAALKSGQLERVPPALSEMEIARLASERAESDGRYLNFIGAGAYEHHIPAAVWQIATRGEFYSAYTPYQAEASQGTLQTLYEFQSMMTRLTGLDVANASLYDGASALGEAILMAVRASDKARRVLVPRSVHPHYRAAARAIVEAQNIELVEIDFERASGRCDIAALQAYTDFAALVVPQPNFFGVLEDADALTDWAHARGALVIAAVNPLSLAVLKPPGAWGASEVSSTTSGPQASAAPSRGRVVSPSPLMGEGRDGGVRRGANPSGADICIGEGQPLGVPLSNGGPYFGFMCCKKALVRQMPGRIVGASLDAQGSRAFVLTLQAREQHIRRSKATSNICTNQGLAVTAATIFMSLAGPQGLRAAALRSHQNTQSLLRRLSAIEEVERVFTGEVFHEAVLRWPQADETLARLRAERILGGLSLQRHYPELGEAVLVCATETKLDADLERYAHVLDDALHGEQIAQGHPT
jgi:glycine dehydrogenase subunit 1